MQNDKPVAGDDRFPHSHRSRSPVVSTRFTLENRFNGFRLQAVETAYLKSSIMAITGLPRCE